jgi:dTDP-4-dehydrorhamnose reductase
MSKIILGDGLLGSELIKISGWDYISRKKDGIDFRDIDSYKDHIFDYDVVINCIADCNTYDENRENHWNVNYKGVVDLVDYLLIRNIKFIQISTDYVYSNSKIDASENDVPVHCENWYGYTKLLADGYVQLKMDNYLLSRGTHKATPFLHDQAYINQVGNFDYVDKVATIIKDLIDGDAVGIYNVGTELKTMYDLAKRTKAIVTPVNKKFHPTMPSDNTINLDKLKKFYEEGK